MEFGEEASSYAAARNAAERQAQLNTRLNVALVTKEFKDKGIKGGSFHPLSFQAGAVVKPTYVREQLPQQPVVKHTTVAPPWRRSGSIPPGLPPQFPK